MYIIAHVRFYSFFYYTRKYGNYYYAWFGRGYANSVLRVYKFVHATVTNGKLRATIIIAYWTILVTASQAHSLSAGIAAMTVYLGLHPNSMGIGTVTFDRNSTPYYVNTQQQQQQQQQQS